MAQEEEQLFFDDKLEEFVKILKLTSKAFEINIFSKERIKIYADVMTDQIGVGIYLDEQERQTISQRMDVFFGEIH